MILARSLPDLSQEDEARSAASLSDEGAPADPEPYDHDYAEAPSFRPLSSRPTDSPETSEKASLSKERSDVFAIATPDPRALAHSSVGAGAVATRVVRTPDEGRLYRVPGLVGPSQRILLLCCVFLTGFAAGLSASRVISFQEVRTALSSVPKALGLSGRRAVPFLADESAHSGELAKLKELPVPTEPRASSLPAAALSDSPRPTVSGLSSDANRVLSIKDNPEVSSEVSALEEQLERQLAEGRLAQPGNDNALDTYRKLAAIAPNDFPLVAILAKDSPEPSAMERDGSARVGTPATSTLAEAAALPTPVVSGETAEPAKRPEAVPGTSVVTSEPAGPRSSGQATTPAVAQPSGRAPSVEPTNPRDGANSAPSISSLPNVAAPLTETAPMASSAAPTPAVAASSPAASSRHAGEQAPDQSASSETVISQDVANPGSVATPAPVVGTNEASASPGPVREQPPAHGTPSGDAASQDVANAGPIASSPSNAAALGPEGPSAIIGIAMSRGDEALAAGDVISARQFYELAASNGLAHAATAVGRTYDPSFLQGKAVRGAFADAEAARRWYQRAIDGGDAEARARLDNLLKVDQGKPAR
jgi:hypothetical protein